ncbi:glycoside hydrolase superfamily [Ilyonectria destructans]|nr:glycoside hydrolase superfamily [Ilyonectria destructans]
MHFFKLSYALIYALPFVKALSIRADNGGEASNLITWDNHSLFIRGERMVLLSGEFHPWRLPSPGLWLDVFQKLKALGYNAASFYVNWALIEGKEGEARFNDVFALEPFFDAAEEAGLYLIARPGPYINSELSGGGLPGRLQRLKGELRSTAPDFLNSTKNYISSVLDIITKAQITNGGPIILVQPENEYSLAVGTENPLDSVKLLEPAYMEFIEQQFRRNGVSVPLISNDMVPLGNWAPGTGQGEVDLYAHDSYPFYGGCGSSEPDIHRGGPGLDSCAALINQDFARVFLKDLVSRSIKILNLYMTYGGTNWGNMGHPEGYTSYDHGASVREDRAIDREKYSEAKLQSHWLHASKAYLTAIPQPRTHAYVSTDELLVTPVFGNKTRFFVLRHSQYDSLERTPYKLSVPTSHGSLTIPRLGGQLTLSGRDSKIHVTDYDVGGINLIYSTAEIFTWKKYGHKRVLILYGGDDELHEFAISVRLGKPFVEGEGIELSSEGSMMVIQWKVLQERRVIHFSDLDVYLLWRNEAYNYWVLDLPDPKTHVISPVQSDSSIIIKGGYLLRNATLDGSTLHITGDLNTTSELEIIAGVSPETSIAFNGRAVEHLRHDYGRLRASLGFSAPDFKLPELSELGWRYLDSLPELSPSYDDIAWTSASLSESNNPRNLTTPVSLYASDYGYHSGSIIYRGHFNASGDESTFNVTLQGGLAFGYSAWLDDAFLGSFAGDPHAQNNTRQFELPMLQPNTPHVFTIVMDHMGLTMNFFIRSETMKQPRGVLDYSLDTREKSAISWKLTGNFAGEDYVDKVRGPLNEGSMFAERQGFHLPGAPTTQWKAASPYDGIPTAGIGMYVTTFDLDMPYGYDIPLSFAFAPAVEKNETAAFRCQLFINGYQFGEYINNLGPQTNFTVPEGVLNYNGQNTVALTLWALEEAGARLKGFELLANRVIQSGYRKPGQTIQPGWKRRPGAY